MRRARPIFPAVGRMESISPRENQLLDLLLDLIVELVAVVPEKFDAVVFVRIVRGGKHDARIRAERARDIGDAWRRQRPDQQHIHAERGNAGDERVLQHVTGEPRVFAEHDFRPGAGRVLARIELGENMRGGAAQLQRRLRRDRLDVRHAADAVRSKNFLLLRHVGY